MPQQVRRRRQVNVHYDRNNQVPERLSRGMVYRELYLYLTGQVDCPAAENLQASIMQGDEWGVVKRIEIIANNTDYIRSFTGNQLWWLNHFLYGVQPRITPLLGDAVEDDPGWCSTLVLPFWMPRSIRPMDTALDARELSDLKIQITWGDELDVIDPIIAPAWITEPALEVHSLESFNVKGPFSQQRVYSITRTVTAATPEFQVILPVGPMYRGFLINTTHDDGSGNPIDTGLCLNNFKIKSGTTIFADVPGYILQQVDGWVRASINRPYDAGLAVANAGLYDDLRRGEEYNAVEGWYFYDHVTDGYLSECIDTLGFSEFELELDVAIAGLTAPINLHVIPLQVIPVRGQ